MGADGRPVRERHEGVRLTYLRGEESGSLFPDGATYEVDRGAGDARIFVGGRRVERRIEKVLAPLLEDQFEFTLGPALFDPGRTVSVGESWTLDPSLARRFLRERGVRAVELGEPATATLVREGVFEESGLVLHYRIPIAWFEPGPMPPNARHARSEAQLEGRIRLASGPGGGVLAHASSLVMSLDGAVVAPRATASTPWSLRTTKLSDQSTQVVGSTIVSGL
jgi:hypothetical protein